MKSPLFALFSSGKFKKALIIPLFITLAALPLNASWTSSTVDSSVGNSGTTADDAYPAIGVDASGDIHIVYFDFTGINDSTQKSKFKYAKIHNSSATVSTIESVFNVGRKAVLKIDGAGAVHTAYYDYTNKNLKYAKYNGSSWTTTVVDGALTNYGVTGDYMSLFLDGSNQPHIAYFTTSGTPMTASILKYAYYDGSWHTSPLISDTSGKHTGYHRALVMDGAGHPYIIFSDDENLKCIKNLGAGWQTETIENVGPGDLFAAIDASGNIYVSYHDLQNSLGKVAKYNGSSWAITTLTGSATGAYGPIAINPLTGYPEIKCAVTQVKYNGTSWVTQETNTVGSGMPCTLAFDSAGNAYTAFYDTNSLPYKLDYAKSTYKLSGRLLTFSGTGTINLSGSATASTTSDTNGNFSFDFLPGGGTYTLTPSATGYYFNPSSTTVTNMWDDNSSNYFYGNTAAPISISGNISDGASPLSGVSVSLTGSTVLGATTNGSGNYSFSSVAGGGSYTIRPSKTDYYFSPASINLTAVTANQTGKDFTGTLNYYISGYTKDSQGTGVTGVTVSLSGTTTATTISSTGGYYEFLNLTPGGNYVVNFSKGGTNAGSTAITINNLSSDTSNQNAVSSRLYYIKGLVKDGSGNPIAGASVQIAGGVSAGTTTDSTGYYEFFNLPEWHDYSVSASLAHYYFASNIPFGGLSGNYGPAQPDPHYSVYDATTPVITGNHIFNVQGSVQDGSSQPVNGVTLMLTGTTTSSAISSGGQFYFLQLPAYSNVIVTPVKPGYTFVPSSAQFNPISDDQNSCDFTATQNQYKVSGHVYWPGGSPFYQPVVTATGTGTVTVTGDNSGYYEFPLLQGGQSYTVVPVETWQYHFTPTVIPALGADTSGTDFTLWYRISGNVTFNRYDGSSFTTTGVSGATITSTVGSTLTNTVLTAGDGTFSLDHLGAGEHVVTASFMGVDMSPTAYTCTNGMNNTNANFSVSGLRYFVSNGSIADLSGTTVTFASALESYTKDYIGQGYLINKLPYTITPVTPGFTYTPLSTIVTANGSTVNVTINHTANYYIDGYVKNAGAVGIGGVVVSVLNSYPSWVSGTPLTTDSNGYYRTPNLGPDTYTFTLYKQNYAFAPASTQCTIVSSSASNPDIIGTLSTYSLSGYLRGYAANPVSGSVVSLTGSAATSVTASTAGYYQFDNLPGSGNFTITPSKAAYTFSSIYSTASLSFTNLSGSETDQNFTGLNYIKGHAKLASGTAVSGVTITIYANSSPITSTTTATDGYYEILNLPAPQNLSIVPGKSGYQFTPNSFGYNPLDGSLDNQDFTAEAKVDISGNVNDGQGNPLQGARVDLTGDATDFTYTGSSGYYSFTVSTGGNFAVAASLTGYMISPGKRNFPAIASNQSAQDFTGVAEADLNTALDNGTLVFTTGGNNLWFKTTSTSVSGGSSLQSGSINYGEEVWVRTSVTGPGVVGFQWSTSCDAAGAGLGVYVDGIIQDSISGTVSWTAKSVSIPSGVHTVEWRFVRDLFGTAGSNCGYLDAVSFAVTYNLSGRLTDGAGTGVSSVTLALFDGSNTTDTTSDTGGNYLFAGVAGGRTYTITPVDADGSYNPSAITCVSLASNLTGRNFSKFIMLSGTITGTGKSGVPLVLTGGVTATLIADVNGAFSTTVPSGLSYTLTPSKLGYSFTPAEYSATYSSNISILDFSILQLPPRSVSGAVKDPFGTGISGAAVTIAGSASQGTRVITAASNGTYSFTNLLNGGDYTVIPAKAGYNFSPAVVSGTNITADSTGNDFTGYTGTALTISGKIKDGTGTGISGVTIVLGQGASSANTTTDTSGNYIFAGFDSGRTYTITASDSTGVYNPSVVTLAALGGNTAGVEMTKFVNVSGTIFSTGNSGVAVVVTTGGVSVTLASDAGGAFSTIAPTGQSYQIAPAKMGYTFNPSSYAGSLLLNNLSGLNFTIAQSPLKSISGTVRDDFGAGLSGVVLTLTGTASETGPLVLTSASDGTYSFTGLLYGGDYTISPVKTGYTFSPAAFPGTNLTADLTGRDFTGNQGTPINITGTVRDGIGTGLAGVTITLARGSSNTNTTTSTSGYYTFTGFDSGQTYIITPSAVNYSYNPAAITCVSIPASRPGSDFVKQVTLSGTIYGSGNSGASVVVTGGAGSTLTPDGSGAFNGTLPSGIAYTLTPVRLGYSFAPANISGVYSTNTSALNFSISQLPLVSISGLVKDALDAGVTGVTLSLTGSAGQTGTCTVTATNGAYAFTGLLNGGDYDITASKDGYVFAPVKMSVTTLTTDVTSRNFLGSKGYTVDITKDNSLSFLLPKGEVKVDVPTGSYSQTVTITASQLASVPTTSQTNISETPIGVEITLTGAAASTSSKPMTITLKYSDADMISFDQDKLVIGWYDDVNNRWVVLTTTRDPIGNVLFAVTTHFSKYAILQLSPSATLDNATVYPNPYRPGSGGAFDSTVMTFAGLTSGARIKVFTVSGALAAELADTGSGLVNWNVTNSSGDKLASGLYFYIITDTAGNKKTGKFSVVR